MSDRPQWAVLQQRIAALEATQRELVTALQMARTEIVTLLPRVGHPFNKSLALANEEIKRVLSRLQSLKQESV